MRLHTIRHLVLAALATACVACPATAAFVVPIAGTIENRISIQQGAIITRRADQDSWLGVPDALSTRTSATYFPAAGGSAATALKIDAGWVSPDAGSISVDFQTLLVPLDINQSFSTGAFGSVAPFNSAWTYRFTANEDSLLTVKFDLLSDFTGVDVKKVIDQNRGSFSINGVEKDFAQILLFDDKFKNHVEINYEIFAGEEYALLYEPIIFFNNLSGRTTVFDASQRLSFSIGARPVVSPVPEPATWAMMIIGFGLIGSFQRRRLALQVAIV